MTKEEKLDINLTFMLELKEVVLRIMTEEIDNPALKKMLKREFKGWYNAANKVDKEFRKYIKQDNRFDDPEELFDSGADYMYNLIKATYGIKSSEGWQEITEFVESVAKREMDEKTC